MEHEVLHKYVADTRSYFEWFVLMDALERILVPTLTSPLSLFSPAQSQAATHGVLHKYVAKAGSYIE